MPIYAKTNNNEYNKIIDIFDTNGIDITDVYHDDQLVYTVSKDILGSTELYYNTDRYDITNFRVYGNTIQDGTPSPEAPVDVVGCGVRTGNLFDFEQLKNAPSGTIEGANFSHLLELQLKANTYYTMASNGTGSTDSTPADLYRSVYFNSKTGEASVNINHPVTVLTDSTGVVRIGFVSERTNAQQYLNGEAQLWINEGNTALPYEPYGFKLPFTVNGVEYPIYLGTAPTTRRIKKLVLTGEENITNKPGNAKLYIPIVDMKIPASVAAIDWYCSHYQAVANKATWTSYDYMISWSSADAGSSVGLRIRDIDFLTGTTLADFKSYLASEYAAGHPVTVWYVLAEPETAIVNEPLHKIGNYADSINIVQSNPQLKLDIGENNIFIPTTVPPSNIELQAKGGISASGTSPLQITRKSEYLSDYKISGDTLQDGIPSPDMPIEVVGCGVRTGNLYDGEYEEKDRSLSRATGLPGYTPGRCYSHKIVVDSSMRLAVTQYPYAQYGANNELFFYDENDNFLGVVRASVKSPATPPENASYCRFFGYTNNRDKYMVLDDPPAIIAEYIPYGFKLPLTVNGTEYPIHLGTVPTTRRVKKLVLTGEEAWQVPFGMAGLWGLATGDAADVRNEVTHFCSHFKALANVPGAVFYNRPENTSAFRVAMTQLIVVCHEFQTSSDFKSYLAAQYAAGTPVTVWYVLAEPETGIVNEPLMKIGDYADTISAEQAGVTIPTVSGANVLDVTSPVKPSEVYIKGKGIKPTGYGQLTDVNDVNILDKNGRSIYVHGQ